MDNTNKLINITGYNKDILNNKLEQERLQHRENIKYNGLLDIIKNKTIKKLATCPIEPDDDNDNDNDNDKKHKGYKIKVRHIQLINTNFNNIKGEGFILITEKQECFYAVPEIIYLLHNI
jgi:hypothetical protein